MSVSRRPLPILARSAPHALGGGDRPAAAPDWLMWMPGGTHTISATRAGKPVTVTVRVDAGAARAAQQSLEEHISTGRQRPFFDFDHEGRAASAWPEEFVWREVPEPGVYARVRWSTAGSEAITGMAYRAFSPSFHVDQSTPARVIGAPLNMGGLVNDPAFEAIAPHFAQHHRNHQIPMTPHQKLVAAQAALIALQGERLALDPDAKAEISAKDKAIAAKRHEIDALNAEINAAAADDSGDVTVKVLDATRVVADKDAEIAALKTRVSESEGALKARREADADAAVQAAVARGVIPAQDKQRQAAWKDRIVADPTLAAELASMGTPIAAGRLTAEASSSRVDVTKTDLVQALRAYGTEPDSVARGRIWADDIRATVEKGCDLVDEVRAINRSLRSGREPVHAANTLGTLTGTLVTQRALDLLRFTFPVLTRISTNFSEQPAKFGQTIQTRLRGTLTSQKFVAADGYQDTNVTTTDVPVVLNQHDYIQVKFGVEELAATMRGLFDEQEDPMHYAIGKGMVDYLYALITAANYSAKTTVAQVDFNRLGVVSVGQSLTKRGVPAMGRSFLLNADYYGQLAADDTIVKLAAYQQPGIITAGQLPDVHGFRVIEAPNLPTTGNLTGFAFRPDAWAMISRPPTDYTEALAGAPSTGVVQLVTNPDTGITVMLVQWVDHLAGASRGRLAIMYGAAKGSTEAAQRLVSA